jgi:hypothetical protein
LTDVRVRDETTLLGSRDLHSTLNFGLEWDLAFSRYIFLIPDSTPYHCHK